MRTGIGQVAKRVLLIMLFALGVPAVADARIEVLRWRDECPDPDRVIGFVVYSGLESQNYDTRIDVGLPVPDADEVYSYDLVVIPEMDSVYVAVTAYDDELESDFSKEQLRVVPEPGGMIQLVLGGIGLACLHRRRRRYE